MQTIQRRTMLYETKVEYGDFCINPVMGCHHGCKYCYQFKSSVERGIIKSYDQWCAPKLASNALELLAKEIPLLKEQIKSVHLSFATDPFMNGYPEVGQMSLQIIEKLNASDIPCKVLTKGILPETLADEKIFSRNNEFGITLVSLSEQFRKTWEPNASRLNDRLAALKKLHDQGCKTWISMEPYPTPNIIEQDLEEILEAVSFVDRIIFGRWNYSPEVDGHKNQKQFYNEQARKVIKYCSAKEIAHYIKRYTITK